MAVDTSQGGKSWCKNPKCRTDTLILNPAARGRERVTSAPFNASAVRDHEKWIHHHHQFFCWFENNEFSSSPGNRGQGGAADNCTSDVAAGHRRMALATVAWSSLKIFHFLTSETFSGTKYYWMSIIGGHQCSCFNFWSWQGWLDEEMALDVSDGPAYSGLVSWSQRRLDLCLKRPSFNCLIHFYKRCVSSLALVSHNLLYSGLKKVH